MACHRCSPSTMRSFRKSARGSLKTRVAVSSAGPPCFRWSIRFFHRPTQTGSRSKCITLGVTEGQAPSACNTPRTAPSGSSATRKVRWRTAPRDSLFLARNPLASSNRPRSPLSDPQRLPKYRYQLILDVRMCDGNSKGCPIRTVFSLGQNAGGQDEIRIATPRLRLRCFYRSPAE